MTMISAIQMQHCDARFDALKAEYGAIMADRIFEAEAVDFLWEARVRERYLGQYSGIECDENDAGEELSRIIFLSLLDGIWHVAIGLVDGDGAAVELLSKGRFEWLADAESAFESAR